MLLKVEGIVISEMAYLESSKIINVLTKEYGIIGVISKGCKQMKSSLRNVSSKLTYGVFDIYYKKDKLSNLVSVDIIDSFLEIKKDLTKISYASFLLELSNQVYKQYKINDIYDLLISALIKINENYNPLVITNIIELKYLEFLGVMPVIDACSICGNTSSIVTISSTKGGYLCKNCYKNELIVSDKTIKLIRMYYYVDISKITKLEVSEKVTREINRFLDEYYDQYTGLYLKSKEFLKNLSKI